VPKITGDRWLEIDVDAIRNNLIQVQSQLNERVRLIAVIKADAYGHGAVETARILYQNGVDFFAVSFLEEALALRQGDINASIMLFCPLVDEHQITLALKNHLTISVTSLFDCKLLDKVSRHLNIKATVHLKLETGLGRFGMGLNEALEVCRILNDNPCIYIEGVYTHMAEAGQKSEVYTRKQFNLFMDIVNKLKQNGFTIPICHCANSVVFLKYPEMHLDAVRIGTLISGQLPVGKFNTSLKLIDPYKFKTRIISLKTLPKGSYLGYYRTARLRQEAQIAVIPVGFNHGLALAVDNRPIGFFDFVKILAKKFLAYLFPHSYSLRVKINGKEYPIKGKIFMQMALVEIPVEDMVAIGDEVEVPVRKTLALGKINRIYMKDGEACKIEENERTTYVVEGDI